MSGQQYTSPFGGHAQPGTNAPTNGAGGGGGHALKLGRFAAAGSSQRTAAPQQYNRNVDPNAWKPASNSFANTAATGERQKISSSLYNNSGSSQSSTSFPKGNHASSAVTGSSQGSFGGAAFPNQAYATQSDQFQNFGMGTNAESRRDPGRIGAPPTGQQQGEQAQGNGEWADTLRSLLETVGGNPMNEFVMKSAISMGQSTLGKYLPGISLLWSTLKPYFYVDNSYVKKKLLRVLFSFVAKDWERLETGTGVGDVAEYAPPVSDVNAPDLYVPSMAMLSYTLIVSLVKGTSGRFSPDVLYDVGTGVVVAQLIEICVIKVAMYLMLDAVSGKRAPNFFDLWSYGYKYVGLCLNMIVAVTLDGCFTIHMVLTGISQGYFVIRTFCQSVRTRDSKSTQPCCLAPASGSSNLVACIYWRYTFVPFSRCCSGEASNLSVEMLCVWFGSEAVRTREQERARKKKEKKREREL